MTTAQKDTIYIDVDDEITSIVEKVKESQSKIVALVLPKRATTLQSIVNMKLLKRSADDAGKRIVLITSETALMPLAGAVGVYTAKNLQSKPEIPSAPDSPEVEEDLLEAEDATDEPEVDPESTVGELSGDEEEVFESDAPVKAAAPVAAKKAKAAKSPKPKKDKKNKVPNFDSFRKRVALGALAGVGLIVFLYLAIFVLPKATITIKTQTSTSNSTIDFTVDTAAQSVDVEAGVIPGKQAEKESTQSEKAAATGQKDLGAKATGTVTLSISFADCPGVCPLTIPGGTGVSTGGKTYITAQDVTLSSFGSGGLSGSVNVKSQENGEQYNISAGQSFSVAGYNSVTGTNGAAFTGGSSKIAKVVSDQDVANAKDKLSDDDSQIKSELQKQLEDEGYYAITDTFTAKDESETVSPKVGEEATEVTVTVKKTYVMTGVRRDDLKALVENSVKDEMAEKSLQVQDDGIDQAVYKLGKTEGNKTSVNMQVQVVLGPKINEDQLKQDIAGKKKGDVQNTVKSLNGVEDAEISFSPFWVSKVPKNTEKITIKYQETAQSE
jgi:hypothetical protein